MGFGGWGGGGGGPFGGRGGGMYGAGGLRRSTDGWSDEELGKAYDNKVVMRLAKYAAPYKWQGLLAVMGTIIYSVAAFTQPVVIGYATDHAMKGQLHALELTGIGLVALALVAWAAYYAMMNSTAWMGERILLTLRNQMFAHLQKLSLSFYDRNEVGRVMSRVQNDATSLETLMAQGFFAVMASFLGLFVITYWMFRLDWILALTSLAVLPFLVVVLWIWQDHAKKAFIRVRQAIAIVNSNLQENISGVRVIQSMNRQGENMRRFDGVNVDNFNANVDAAKLTAIVNPPVEIAVAVSTAVVIVFGGIQYIHGAIQVGVILAFAIYVQQFYNPVRQLVMQYAQLQRAMAGGQRVFEVLDTKPEIVDRPEALPLPPVKGEVRFDHVTFGYVPEVEVLHDINLAVSPGQTIALVGQTGSGKTTMTALVERLYDVTAGSIRIDGYDVRDIQRQSLARQMGVVLQDPFLFSGTVWENIRFGQPEATDAEIIEAAKAVGAHDFIMQLENGYDTVLEERGQNISLGQRQLLSFARAVAANPRIVVLDEATARVDSTTEARIQHALKELLKGRTSFVIAHRLSTIRGADRIVAMQDGKIVEEGTHTELLARDGVYSRLYKMTYESETHGANGHNPDLSGSDTVQRAG